MKSHIKRRAVPKTWDVPKKKPVFIIRPHPGAHKQEHSISLATFLKEYAKVASNQKEARFMLNKAYVTVDGKVRTEPKYPVGLFDVIEIKAHADSYRLVLNKKGKLVPVAESKEKLSVKPVKIISKTQVKGKTQLNLFSGRNILIEKDEYKTGDTLLMSLPDQKIKSCIKLEKGNAIYIIGGQYIGNVGEFIQIKDGQVIFKLEDGAVFKTPKKFIYAIGEKQPAITVL